MKAGFKKVETTYYTNWYITSGDTEVLLYASNGSQYSWLENYLDKGEDFTVEVAPCNWNSKDHFAACILSVTDSNGNQVFNT